MLAWLSWTRCRLACVPADVTASCFSKIQTGFTFLVLAVPGNPGQRAIKWVCASVCVVTQKNKTDLYIIKEWTEISLTAVQFIRPVSAFVISITDGFRQDTAVDVATFEQARFAACYTTTNTRSANVEGLRDAVCLGLRYDTIRYEMLFLRALESRHELA